MRLKVIRNGLKGMVSNYIGIGILIGVFFLGIGVSYAMFTNTFDPMTMKFHNQQMFDQMMSQNPKMTQHWMDSSMMQSPQQMQQMMQDPQFRQQMMEQMNTMMNDPEQRQQMMNMMMQNQEFMQEMMKNSQMMDMMRNMMGPGMMNP